MPPRGKTTRQKGRQTSISDFFSQTPPRPSKRRSTNRSPARSPARVDEPVIRHTSPSPPPDPMDIEPPSDPAKELTQEELDVHDQLESLGCSQKRPRGPTADETDSTPPRGEQSDDGEDSDCSIQDMERSVALRRSTRITKEVVRFSADVNRLRGTSVFGNGFSTTKNSGTEMKRAFRELNKKVREEQELEKMRKQVVEAAGAGQDESLFKEMADAEERAEEMRRQAQEKYSTPIPLFCKKVAMRKMPKQQKRKRSGSFPLHPVHDLVVQALKAGDEDADIALSFVVPVVKGYCKSRDTKGLARLADYLFQLAVFDPTDDKPGRLSRDFLVGAIEDIIHTDLKYFKSSRKVSRLQGVISVLECYGAVFHDKSDPHQIVDIKPAEESLDWQAPMVEIETDDKKDKGDENYGSRKNHKDDAGPPPVSDEFNRSDRNLGRLFRIAAAQVSQGVPLGLVLREEALPLHDSVLLCLGVCTRVLLSAFGNRLHLYVGELIEASLLLIDEDEWPEFRMKAATYIHSFTTRLELHVELVTYLLPYIKPRSRSLALDVAYFSLQQWCASNMPAPISTSFSERAQEVGIKTVSFCLSDVVRHMQSIPDLKPGTDMNWISLLSRLLKVLLSEESVLEGRLSGELGALKKILGKLRISTRRLGLDVPVQRMRMALDAVERILQEYAKGSERSEIGMFTQHKKQQGSLVAMRATV